MRIAQCVLPQKLNMFLKKRDNIAFRSRREGRELGRLRCEGAVPPAALEK